MNVDAEEFENAVFEIIRGEIRSEIAGWTAVCADPKAHNLHAVSYAPDAVVALVVLKRGGN